MAVPGKPTAVSASDENGQSTVSWIPADATALDFIVTPYIGVTAQATTPLASNGTSVVVPGLANGTAYTFTVIAHNATGNGAASDPSAAVTPSTVPGAPTSVTATSGEDTQSTVTWVAPASTGGDAITAYRVTPYIAAAAQATQSFGAVLSGIVTSLVNGTSYTFKVEAFNAEGYSAQSTASAAHVPAVAVATPDAPTAVPGSGDAVISWVKATGASTYKLTVYEETGDVHKTALDHTAGDVATYTLPLDPTTKYKVTVTALHGSAAYLDSAESAKSTQFATLGGKALQVAQRVAPSDVALLVASGGGSQYVENDGNDSRHVGLHRVGSQIGRTEASAVTMGTTIMSDKKSVDAAFEPVFSDRVGPEVGVTTTITGNPPAPLAP